MIESIQIENFQAHSSLRIDLDRVTTLVGPTDAGKSSVARFLRWVFLNESAGDITTWGERFTRGVIIIEGHEMVRKKSGKENYYSLDQADPYDAVGRSVPPDVAALLNVGDVNFQGQLDAHFWLADTPGEVSRQLNQVVELSAMDDLTSAMASEVSTISASVRAKQEALDNAKAKRAELKWVDDACAEFTDVEHTDREATQIRARIESLAKVVQRATDARQTMSDALELAIRGQGRLKDAGTWVEALGKAVTSNERVTSLEISIQRIGVIHRMIGESKVGAETMRKRTGDAGAWMEAVDALKKKTDEYQKLARMVVSVDAAQTVAYAARRNAAQAKDLLVKQTIDGVCPLCGTELGADKCRT